MSETAVNLTDDQLKAVLMGYAQGKTTTQIVDDLIFEFGLEDSSENRTNLREQMRTVNPNDKRFAKSKYGALYEIVRVSVVEELRKQSRDGIAGVIASIHKGFENLDEISLSLTQMLNNASDFDITSNSEFLNTVRTLTGLQKVRIEGVNALSGLVEQLVKLNASGSGSQED